MPPEMTVPDRSDTSVSALDWLDRRRRQVRLEASRGVYLGLSPVLPPATCPGFGLVSKRGGVFGNSSAIFKSNPAPSPPWVVVDVDDVGLVVTLPTPDSPGFIPLMRRQKQRKHSIVSDNRDAFLYLTC